MQEPTQELEKARYRQAAEIASVTQAIIRLSQSQVKRGALCLRFLLHEFQEVRCRL